MPPEPLPWDRKDFFRERKQERSESLGSVARWRDSSHHGSRELNRWGSTDFRRPLGHGKQGGWRFFSEVPGHGYASRSSEKVLEDDGFRPSNSRGEGKYGRSSRENRGSYNQREWRGHTWETNNGFPSTPGRVHDVNNGFPSTPGRVHDVNNGFPSTPGRVHDMNNEQKSREDLPPYSPYSNGSFGNTWDQAQFKDQHEKAGGSMGLGTAQRCDRKHSLGINDWKPMKWTRSGSLSSRGSGFSHLSCSKTTGAVDSIDTKVESQMKNATPVQSPSADANACVASSAPSEEMTSRKKPRLGWGEGLAKYEKKKVEVPEVTFNRDGVFAVSNAEPSHSLSSSLIDKSPRVTSFSDCASPATPSSVACSSSPGVEEKSFGKAVSIDNDGSNLCGSPGPVSLNHGPVSLNHSEGFSFNLEKMDSNSISTLGSSLVELLQSDYPSSVDSTYVRSTAINKLLIWKAEISKTLEVTETEIDSLENELKSLKSITIGSSPSVSCSLPAEDRLISSEEEVITHLVPRPALLQIRSTDDAVAEELPISNSDKEEACANVKAEDVDSPGTVTSKFVEPLSLAKAVSSSDLLNHATGNSDGIPSTNQDVQHSVPGSGGEETVPDTYEDCSMLTEGEITAPIIDTLGSCTDGEVKLQSVILSSNKELAKGAHDVFNKLLPQNEFSLDSSEGLNASSQQDYTLVKEKFLMRKQFKRFKERVITLKFRAFQSLWKEDMRLLSIRKHRAKSQKKLELSLRSVHNGYQKHRSSIRSRFSSPAGNLSLVPTAEVVNFTSKLLLDSQVKLHRNNLKMPALILDEREKIVSRFISNNGLVEDPCVVEKERAMINPWTPEEKEIFMDKLASCGKDFKKIASFLDHKTTADCVEFYYKNHKSDSFEKKKKLDCGKQVKSLANATYLKLNKKWNREMNAASLDILDVASVMAANADDCMRNQKACSGRLIFGGLSESKASRGDYGTDERSSSIDIVGNDRETFAADILAGLCGSLSSEAMSSCITSSVDPVEGYREWRSQKVDSVVRRPLTPDVTQYVDDGTCSDESCGEMDPTDWTDEEKAIFVQAVTSYGRDFAKISQCVRSRSRDQCKVFFSKARKCLGLDLIHPGPENERTFTGDDANGSGSGSENVCAREMGSGICSDKSGSKMDEDLPLSAVKMKNDETDPAENFTSLTAQSRSEGKNEREQLNSKRNIDASESQLSDSCPTQSRPNVVSDGDSKRNIDVQSRLEEKNGREQLSSKRNIGASETQESRPNVVSDGDSKRNIDASESQESRPNVVSDGDSTITQGVGEAKVIPIQETLPVLSSIDTGRDDGDEQGTSVAELESVSEGNENDKLFNTESVVGKKPVDEVSSDELANLMDRLDEKCNASTSGQSGLDSVVQDSNSTGNASHMTSDRNSCSGFSLNPDYQRQVSIELNSKEKSCVIPLAQEIPLVSANSISLNSGAIRCEKNGNEDKMSSSLDFQESRDVCHISVCKDESNAHVTGLPILTDAQSSQVLRACPVRMNVKVEVNGDVRCRNSSEVQGLSSSETSSNASLLQNCYLQRCSNVNPSCSTTQFPLMSQNTEQASDRRKSRSQSLSDSEKPSRIGGDVKLFGKILTAPSLPKADSNYRDNEENEGSNNHKLSNQSNMKFANLHNSDGNSTLLNFDHKNYLGIENVQMRNYSYWDGNRLQATFPSVPDSAILLAKYPAAFSNFSAPSSTMEQQSLQSVVNSNELDVNGVSAYPTREISNSKGMVDYQVYRSREAAKVQPFTVDVNQRQDMFSEVQRRNGIETISSFQHQGRGMVGINVLGRGGIVVGGGCTTGVTDPVVALKRHFAKTEQQYGGQSSSIIREDESWRGNGDMSR
ncbi:hypothetical protein G4B88_011549 [Cannabis sativa]|uniref:Uncharacterized protein n=1 Tax=Cannabis sativa TaxID=3483 RepID=A0A7J6GIT4_CANSA|nr:hypothetical protein G4B88_011549 [Cannabis sativa]